MNFPSFSEGLSLRPNNRLDPLANLVAGFPFLFGRAFIEAMTSWCRAVLVLVISLPFRKGFH